MDCTHEQWTAKLIPLSDGRPALREFCATCGVSNGGSNLGFSIPIVADNDVYVHSYKYPGKTLGQIAEVDRAYLEWFMKKSAAKDRDKKAAARIYYNEPYTPPKDGDVYPMARRYNPMRGAELLRKFLL